MLAAGVSDVGTALAKPRGYYRACTLHSPHAAPGDAATAGKTSATQAPGAPLPIQPVASSPFAFLPAWLPPG